MISYKTLTGILNDIENTANKFDKDKEIGTASTKLMGANIALKVHALEHAIYRFKTERIEDAKTKTAKVV